MADAPIRLKRRWLYIPFAVAAVIVAGYWLLWRAGAAEMKKGVADWVEDQRNAGFEVSHGALKAEGFPFFLRVHVATPEIAAPGVWRWRTERLTLDALPYDLNRLIFSVRSEQHVETADYGAWRVNADDFRFSIANDKARGWVFAMNVGDAHAVRDEDNANAAVEQLVFDLAPSAEDPAMLVLSLAAANIKAAAPDGAFRLNGVQTVMAATQTQALGDADRWRQAGGEFIINGFNAQLDEAKLSVAGTLSLDAARHPKGALKTEIVAPESFVKALSQLGLMSEEEADSAGAALTLAAIAGGGKISAPIEFNGGAAHLAGVKIFEMEN
ncbi:DUF2125 domain-containing protein [Hyphococcus luteus]|uniref:DUF2125 domain-containing protein n=1 Tax=Hyphococcus luteus TaxID=2058213 RepID=A0A2S7K614_9PROT|nr:DUF2125 domain-containing protein [Marinicaulis flavus]PQA87955.1 hypothetical protein CW354_06350 [Marinicaulis flavus]